MPKKSPPPKKPKFRLESRKSVRWSICSEIAQYLYYSNTFDAELKNKLNQLIDESYNQCN